MIGVERTDFVAILARDRERARRFYGETLGLRRNELAHEEWPELETGNLTLAIITPEQIGRTDFTPTTVPIALRVPNVEEARKKLEAAGVEFPRDTLDSGVCRMAVFRDPDGNSLMLHRRYAPYKDGTRP